LIEVQTKMQPEAVGAPGCCWFQLAVKYFLPGLYCLPPPSLWGESNPSISRPFARLIRRLSIRLALNLSAYRIRHGKKSRAIAVPRLRRTALTVTNKLIRDNLGVHSARRCSSVEMKTDPESYPK
jgi:hypothetical protein